jgi:hypothetical protein
MNTIIVIIFISSILIILFVLINNFFKKKDNENFNNKIVFLKGYELYKILKEDNDNYYKTFFDNDFYSRKIKNINEYIELIKSSPTDFNDSEKLKLTKCIKEADVFFENIFFEWFDGKKSVTIPWVLGIVKNKLYENGLPHTRNNIIIISKDNINDFTELKLTKTLIHEKVHIYQKIYKNEVITYLKKNNFIKYKKKSNLDNIRSNPDLDNWIYKDSNNNILKAVYNNNPSSIEDIKYLPINNQSYEHPYEKMAIEIEKLKK